jgi:selenide, water dikinase
LLATLPKNLDPNLLVGFGTSDDAGVYRLTDDMALVTTADFITPPVNDPYLFGQIAAANAISDIYAMGGRPITCLNLAAFPSKKLEPQILHQIVAGALNKITEAGAVLAGGHTIEDDEPKFGLAVTGIVHPDKIWTNSHALPGDVLILTKPLGSGVLFNANRKKWVSETAMASCYKILTVLNKTPAGIMGRFDIHAVTDVTGFGLAGHGFEMARASKVRIEIELDRLPIMDEALEMYRRGMTTGVNRFNRELAEANTLFKNSIPAWHQEIVFDPQTSGGLLVSLPQNEGEAFIGELHKVGVADARIIGQVEEKDSNVFLLFS